MLRTIISLCALLAALFFVFRGIQESTAHGQTLPTTETASTLPSSYQQLLLQRAKQLHKSRDLATKANADALQALELAIEEIELGWQLTELLAEQESLSNRLTPAAVEPAYTAAMKLPQRKVEPLNSAPVEVEQRDIASVEETQEAEEVAQPEPPKRVLTRSEQILSNKIRRVLAVYRGKMEMSANDKNCWEFMHTMIGYGVHNYAWVGRNRFNTIGYLCWNGKCRGFQLFDTVDGQLRAKQGYGVQGHHGQFLAMLAQHRVSPEYNIKVDDQKFTIHDLVAFEQETCKPKSELTFKLIALTHYLESEATWSNEYGEWSIPRLIREELAQPVVGSACGGTHRLMGLSYAVRYREKRGEPMTGEWKRADDFTKSYQRYAFNLQNRNGSFSTKWFEGRADNRDTQRYQETTGHIAEWLAYSLPEDQLRDRRMVYAINFLANLMLENHDFEWKIGPRGHAIRALALYHERAFGDSVIPQLAGKPNGPARR